MLRYKLTVEHQTPRPEPLVLTSETVSLKALLEEVKAHLERGTPNQVKIVIEKVDLT